MIKFMVFGDLHYDEMQDGDKRLDELKSKLKEYSPDFCVSLGDFCEPNDRNQLVRSSLEEVRIPIYYVIGNHELDHQPLEMVNKFLGLSQSYYSFEIQDCKFIVLNTCFWSKDGEEHAYLGRNYKEQGAIFPIIPTAELEWLKEELKDDKKHIIFSHHSLVNDFAQRGVSNRKEIQKLLKKHNVILCMNGHDHGDAMKLVDEIPYYAVNSASYMWAGSQIASSEELSKKYGHQHGILPYKQALHVLVEIDEKEIRIKGMDSEYASVTPEDIGLSEYRWNGVSILPKTSSYILRYRYIDKHQYVW